MSCCCIFDTKETSIDNTKPNIRTPIIIFGYEEILPYMNIKCLICNEKVCDILVYCYSCKIPNVLSKYLSRGRRSTLTN